ARMADKNPHSTGDRRIHETNPPARMAENEHNSNDSCRNRRGLALSMRRLRAFPQQMRLDEATVPVNTTAHPDASSLQQQAILDSSATRGRTQSTSASSRSLARRRSRRSRRFRTSPTREDGMEVEGGGSGNTIGGLTAAASKVISGNAGNG